MKTVSDRASVWRRDLSGLQRAATNSSRLGTALLPLLPLLLTACGGTPQAAPPPLVVDTMPATAVAFRDEVATISTMDALEAVQLAAQAGGRIEQLNIRQGDRVRAGQLLVVLDQAQLQAQRAELVAKQAKDRLNLQRFQFLARVGAASAIQRDELQQTYISSKAELKALEADLTYRDLRSPIDGIVGDVSVKVGDVISAGDPFTSLIRNGRLNARIDVPASFRRRLKPGQSVILEDPGTQAVLGRGVIDSIDPSVNAGNQVLLVKAGFDNRDGGLRDGLRVRTRVVLHQREQLSVPVTSVTQSSGQSYVFRLGTIEQLRREPGPLTPAQISALPAGSRVALQTRVDLGSIQNGRYPVLRGLREGDPVITSQLLSLRHGMAVTPAGR